MMFLVYLWSDILAYRLLASAISRLFVLCILHTDLKSYKHKLLPVIASSEKIFSWLGSILVGLIGLVCMFSYTFKKALQSEDLVILALPTNVDNVKH